MLLLAIALGSALSVNGFHHFGINIESGSLWIPTLVISYVLIPYVGRPVRGQVLSLREKEFVEAAVGSGAGPIRIMFSDLLPNIASTVLVFFTLIIATNILTEAGLSFLGAGVRLPDPSWGNLIASGQEQIVSAPWLTLVPGNRDRPDRALAEHLRRRPPGRARPACQGEDRALMLAFIIRRIIGMIAVLFAVSVLVFVIFILVPGGDPASRHGGQEPDRPERAEHSPEMGLRPSDLRPVREDDGEGWQRHPAGPHGEYDVLTSFQNRQNVAEEIKKGIPATFSLCIGAGIIWLVFGVLVGVFAAVNAGKFPTDSSRPSR